MQRKVFTPESKSLLPVKLPITENSPKELIRYGNDVIHKGLSDVMNVADAIKSAINREKDLYSVMLERNAYETAEYQKNADDFINKFVILKDALDRFSKTKGEFKINGSDNWAFYTDPFASYSIKNREIRTPNGIVSVKYTKDGTAKPVICKRRSPFGNKLRECSVISYGKTEYGRVTKMRQLNQMLDELYTVIYGIDLEKTPIGKNIHALQPMSGSIGENVLDNIGKGFERVLGKVRFLKI